MKLNGVIVPLLTPLHADESLDEPSLERHIEYVLDGGVRGIFLLGSTGEFAGLGPEVKLRLIELAVAIVARRVPVLAGVNEIGTRQSILFGERCARLGVDVLVASAPFYYNHSQRELVRHFEAICRSTSLPVALYNIPQRVKLALNVETVRELAQLPNVIGLKDSAGDMAVFQQFLDLRQALQNFSVWQGSDLVAAISVARGADGVVLGQSNVAPRLCADLYNASALGDFGRAWILQQTLTTLFSIVLHKSGPAGMKTALSLMGICQRHVTAPFEALSEDQVAKVALTLDELGLHNTTAVEDVTTERGADDRHMHFQKL